MALLLGEDSQGYDLARKLESHGVWRTWLGDDLYSTFIHCLTSPSSWDVFMKTDDSKSRAQIHLQLRVRALLFDKASLFLRPPHHSSSSSSSSSSSMISMLNPNYLQLHGDDIYFSYEDCPQDELQQQRDGTTTSKKAQQKLQSKAALSVNVGSRYSDKDMDKRLRHDEFPETWYNQFFEKYRVTKPYRIASADQEGDKRTPEQMSSYIMTNEKIKRRRAAFKEDETNYAIINRVSKTRTSNLDEAEAIDDDSVFFPEIMFPFNCVPSSTFPPMRRLEQNRKIDFNGILDSLPKIMAKNPTMIERLGIRPENMGMEQQGGGGGGHQFHGKAWDEGKRRQLSENQASEISRKVIARNLADIGFDSSCKTSVDVLSQLLSCHTCKLGRVLRTLTDNYRKKCSAVELVKMFLHTTGYSNLGGLAEVVKDSSRNNPVQQTQQQLQMIQPHLHPQLQAHLRQPQQVTRQMHPQMQLQLQMMQLQQQQMVQQQMVQPQNLAFQQQQQHQQQMERIIRRRQPVAAAAASTTATTTTTTIMNTRPMVQVKIENQSEFTPPPMESNNNTFGAGGAGAAGGMMNIRHPQLQFQQHHQIAAMSNLQAQLTHQYNRPSPLLSVASHHQIPQVQTPNSNNGGNSSLMRAQPVKVEGFQELMGGDLATVKLDNNNNAGEGNNGKITSPPLPQPQPPK